MSTDKVRVAVRVRPMNRRETDMATKCVVDMEDNQTVLYHHGNRMGKSRSEIQKTYRERKKVQGPEFLEKERLRQKQYYTPAAELSKRKRTERNLKNKFRNRLSRLRKRQQDENTSNIGETSGYESATDQVATENEVQVRDRRVSSPLIVQLPAIRNAAKSKGLKTVRGRALARANKKVRKLKEDLQALRKKVKARDRKILRMKTKHSKQNRQHHNADLTPNKQTETDMNNLKLTPKRNKIVRRKLMIANTVMAEIKVARESTSARKRQNLHRIVSGRIARKYRCLSHIERTTGLSRKSLAKVFDKNLKNAIPRESRICKSRIMRGHIIKFLARDDNSRMQPGKGDAKKTESGEKQQTRVLTDYMKNLYDKYISENPGSNISLTTFQRLRPNNIQLTSFISRNTCQCVHHQNMALKVQAIRKTGIKISQNPEALISRQDEIDQILENLPESISYKVWKKVEVEPGKMRMKVIENKSDPDAFRNEIKLQLKLFAEHVFRVKEQYNQVKALKDNLPDDEMMLQMDFAENYACRSLNEIQTAYWNQSMVTLHPIVAYYTESSELKHQSFVAVSDEMSHSASSVYAFIDKVMPYLKQIKPNLKTIHYWTDSPSSQYRNKYIFNIVANHSSEYQAEARWNYFEAGHGKGPCDGLGGTVKRMADEAIRQGRTVIQDAPEFFAWADNSSMKGVKFLYVSKTETQLKQSIMSSTQIKPLKGTMKLHAVGATKDNKTLMTRETSCYCAVCLTRNFCDSWLKQTISKTAQKSSTTMVDMETTDNDKPDEQIDNKTQSTEDPVFVPNVFKIDEFVAVIYDKQWYIGQIVDKDIDDGDYEINFMIRAKGMFRWPQNEDRIWVQPSDILCKIHSLSPSGKSMRLFKLSEQEHDTVTDMFTYRSVD